MSDEMLASEHMQKFFTKLLAVKEFARKEAEATEHPGIIEIYQRLDAIIKNGDHDAQFIIISIIINKRWIECLCDILARQ